MQAEILEERQVRQLELQYWQVVPLTITRPELQLLTQLLPYKNPLVQLVQVMASVHVLQGLLQTVQITPLRYLPEGQEVRHEDSER